MDEQQELYGQEQPSVKPADFLETPEYQSAEYGAESQGPQPQQPQQEDSSSQVLESLAQKGYDVSQFSNDEDLINETEARFAASEQARSDLAEHQERLQRQFAYQQNQQAPAQETTQGQPAEKSSENPEFDPSWANLVEQDETGRFVVRDEYVGSVDPSVAERVNDYVSWRQDRSNKLIEDPVGTVLESGLGDQIETRVRNAISQEMHRSKVEGDAKSFIQDNAEILYVKNAQTGDYQKDPNGNPILSAAGQALNNAHITLRQQGMYDPVARHQVAMQMVQNQMNQASFAGAQAQQQQQYSAEDTYKQQYTDQPFAQPTNPMPPGYMPNTPVQPTANALGANGLPEHNSLGSLATALAVHKGFLQPKG